MYTTHYNTCPTKIPDLLPDEPITRNTKNGTELETLRSNGNAKNPTPNASNVTTKVFEPFFNPSKTESSSSSSNIPGVWPATTLTTNRFEPTTTIAGMGLSTIISGVPTTTTTPNTAESTTRMAATMAHTTMPNTGGVFKSYTSKALARIDFMDFYTKPSTSSRIASNSYESRIDTTVPKTPDMNGIVSIPRFPTTPPKSKGCGSNKTQIREYRRIELDLRNTTPEKSKQKDQRRVLRAPKSNGCGSNKTTTTELECVHMKESREKSEQKYTNNAESNTMMAATESIFNVMANSTAPSKSTTELELRARMEASRVASKTAMRKYRKTDLESISDNRKRFDHNRNPSCLPQHHISSNE